jgi:type II secretory pathway component PulC
LPKSHQNLLHGYKFKYTPNNTLKNDKGHIGYIWKDKIVVAAPWNYSRSFTTLHEIAHLVWEYKMTPELKKEWSKLVKKHKKEQKENIPKKSRDALDQNEEEIFSMTYATLYSKHPVITYYNKDWMEFISSKLSD